MQKSFILLVISSCFIFSTLRSQQEYTLHFTRDLIQSMHTNPAIRSEHKFAILLPSVAFNFGNNAFSFNDLVKESPNYDSTYIDMDGVLDKMSEENILQIQSELDVIGVYYAYKKWFFSMFVTERFDFRLTYPKDLVDLMWNGNAKFIGETIEIGPGLHFDYLKEFRIGAGRQLNKWDVGMNLKLISGMANITSVKDKLSLTTAESNYATTLSTDYEIRTSGTENPLANFLLPPKNFENPGFAFDFGAVYHHNDQWEFSQSVLDLGTVKWKHQVVKYKSNGSFTYSGVDLAEFIQDEEIYFDNFRDSLKELYFREEKGGSYWSSLVPETYTSALYKKDDKTSFGGLVHLTYFSGVQFGMSLYAGRKIMRYLHVGMSYSIKNRRYDNVGLNLNIGPKGFTVFVVTDNLFNFLRTRSGKNVTWRYGINISIGPKKQKNERPELDLENEVQPTIE